MKKKLLSVLMAGALVATSSVNAFAAGTTTLTGEDTRTLDSEINITGDVVNDNGETKPGTLSVTVPTAASFTVSQDGVFSGPMIEVANNGDQEVDIFAYEFVDTNGTEGINVVKPDALANKNRTHVTLRLAGNRGTAYFTTDHSDRGVYGDAGYTQAADSTGVKIARVPQGQTSTLTLQGDAGASKDTAVSNAEKDAFTLRLKIAKSTDK